VLDCDGLCLAVCQATRKLEHNVAVSAFLLQMKARAAVTAILAYLIAASAELVMLAV
jgi:hypothetical protein